jgi:hypothetical protein
VRPSRDRCRQGRSDIASGPAVVELAYAFEAVQDGRICIEKINGPFLYQLKGTPAEYKAAPERAIANVGYGCTRAAPT